MDAESLYANGLQLYKDGAVQEALEPLRQAREAFKTQGNELKAAAVSNDLGVVYYLTGRREEAGQVLREACAAYEKNADAFGQGKALGNLAQLMNRSGDKTNAEKNYLQAAELFHKAGERSYESDTFRALSHMHLRAGRWMEALVAYDRALEAKGGSGLIRMFFQIPLRLLGVRK